MLIRNFKETDIDEIAELFYETVHSVNAKDYTEEELFAWAGGQIDKKAWTASFLEHNTFVAEEDGTITGFIDIAADGYVDRLYIHRDFQKKGTASALLEKAENSVSAGSFYTHASLTAMPFFLKKGYKVIKEQRVLRKGIYLRNFIMEKAF